MRESTWKISTMVRLATNPDEIYGESVFFRLYVYLDLIGGVFFFDEKNKIIRVELYWILKSENFIFITKINQFMKDVVQFRIL